LEQSQFVLVYPEDMKLFKEKKPQPFWHCFFSAISILGNDFFFAKSVIVLPQIITLQAEIYAVFSRKIFSC
jgi:hypothetical protein